MMEICSEEKYNEILTNNPCIKVNDNLIFASSSSNGKTLIDKDFVDIEYRPTFLVRGVHIYYILTDILYISEAIGEEYTSSKKLIDIRSSTSRFFGIDKSYYYIVFKTKEDLAKFVMLNEF